MIKDKIKNGSILNTEDILHAARYGMLKERQIHGEDLFFDYYSEISVNDTESVTIPYIEIAGLMHGETYIENQNLFFSYVNEDAGICEYLKKIGDFRTPGFPEDYYTAEKEAEGQRGHFFHPPKLWIKKFISSHDSSQNKRLEFTFGHTDYLYHKVYQNTVDVSRKIQNDFENSLLENIKNPAFTNQVWANCGGGVFILTSDNYLVLSKRSQTNVADLPGVVSYSSSGSYDRYKYDSENGAVTADTTPAMGIINEMNEELGLTNLQVSDLTLISFGADLQRQFLQFSYFWKTSMTAAEIIQKKLHARDAAEQETFFVPFSRQNILTLLKSCELEPSAAFALYGIQKNGQHILDIQL